MRFLPALLAFLVFSSGAGLRNILVKRRNADPGPTLVETLAAATLVGFGLYMGRWHEGIVGAIAALVSLGLFGYVLRAVCGRAPLTAGGSGDFDASMSEPAGSSHSLWHRMTARLMQIGAYESGIVLTLFYYVVMLPFGLMVRFRHDPLRLAKPSGDSFWQTREPEEPSLDGARRQFD